MSETTVPRRKRTRAASPDMAEKIKAAMTGYTVENRALSARGQKPKMEKIHQDILATANYHVDTPGTEPKEVKVPWPGGDPSDLIQGIRSTIRRNGHSDVTVFTRQEKGFVVFHAGPARKRASKKKSQPPAPPSTGSDEPLSTVDRAG